MSGNAVVVRLSQYGLSKAPFRLESYLQAHLCSSSALSPENSHSPDSSSPSKCDVMPAGGGDVTTVGCIALHVCPCGKQFKRRATYQRHVDLSHSSSKCEKCLICDKTFGNFNTLTMHMSVHRDKQEQGNKDGGGEAVMKNNKMAASTSLVESGGFASKCNQVTLTQVRAKTDSNDNFVSQERLEECEVNGMKDLDTVEVTVKVFEGNLPESLADKALVDRVFDEVSFEGKITSRDSVTDFDLLASKDLDCFLEGASMDALCSLLSGEEEAEELEKELDREARKEAVVEELELSDLSTSSNEVATSKKKKVPTATLR